MHITSADPLVVFRVALYCKQRSL